MNRAKNSTVHHLADVESGLGEKYGVGKGPWKEVCWLEPLEEAALVEVALAVEPGREVGAGGACSWGIPGSRRGNRKREAGKKEVAIRVCH